MYIFITYCSCIVSFYYTEVKKSQVTESEASVSGGNDIELQEIHSSSLEEIVDKPPSSPTNYSM